MSTFASLNVLLVDDSAVQRQYLAAVCNDLGVGTLLQAESGEQALELLRGLDHKLDIAICDLNMPGMDGVELIRRLADERLISHIIVLSAMEPMLLNTVSAMAQLRGMQVLGAVAKPITADKLGALLVKYRPSSLWRDNAVAPMALQLDDLRRAIAECRMDVHFQPQANVADKSIVGVEALVRWKHPEYGLVPPYLFLPMVEDNGLMDHLTAVVLGKSLAQLNRWSQLGLPLRLSVNLSAQSLSNLDFADMVADMVARHHVNPANVMLEITETSMMVNLASCYETLARLKLKGFHLSLDDFGTGYSSLQQLSQIPLTELKIDRSIVHDSVNRPQLAALLQSAVEMGRRLKLQTVAEGIETIDDWHMLRFAGCDRAQGFLLAKPMPADLMLKWLTRNRPLLPS